MLTSTPPSESLFSEHMAFHLKLSLEGSVLSTSAVRYLTILHFVTSLLNEPSIGAFWNAPATGTDSKVGS